MKVAYNDAIGMKQDAIHIACCSDENLLMPLTVMLKSMFINCANERNIIVYLLDAGISNKSKNRLLRSISPYSNNIEFVKINDTILQDMKVSGHISRAAYYRFLLDSYLPKNLNKVIYLDADLIVCHNIAELWDVDIDNYHLFAVQEQGKDYLYVSSSGGLLNFKELGLEANHKYFNSGVLVINLDKWRKDNIGLSLINYAKENKRDIRYWDQDIMNAVLAYGWKELDYRWNLLSQIFFNSSWDEGPIKDKKTYQRLIRHPYIIHFNTGSKPWLANNWHPYRRRFFHYLDTTDWKGWRPEGYYKDELKKIIKFLLKGIFHIPVARIRQACRLILK